MRSPALARLSRRPVRLAIPFLLVGAGCVALFAQPATRPADLADASPAAIDRSIRDLGDRDPDVRDRAVQHLYRVGEPARDALAAASLRNDDGADRARRLVAVLDQRRAEADPAAAAAARDVDVKFQVRGYAGSLIRDRDALGGFGPCDNFPRPVDVDKDHAGRVYLQARPDEPAVSGKQHKGVALYLVNATDQRQAFAASDSRLYIVQEAKDASGAWRPIEYLPSSWCGNSYHRVLLDPGEGWRFVAPRYTGTFKTKLRFSLASPQRGEGKQQSPILSNEFDGSINPEQLDPQRKQGHTPNDIMDPYND